MSYSSQIVSFAGLGLVMLMLQLWVISSTLNAISKDLKELNSNTSYRLDVIAAQIGEIRKQSAFSETIINGKLDRISSNLEPIRHSARAITEAVSDIRARLI